MGNKFFTFLGLLLLAVAGVLLLKNGLPGRSVSYEVPPEEDQACIQVITRAKNPATGEEQDFPTPCDVPDNWQVVQPRMPETSAMRIGENAVFVSDQKPGTTITVGVAALGADGFLVIHEDLNGKPGKVIGASDLLMKGEHQKFTVTLDRPMRDGEMLHATLHQDDGDNTFSPQEDQALKDPMGNDIVGQFNVSTTAEVINEVML